MWGLLKDFCVIQSSEAFWVPLSAYLQGLGRGFGTNLPIPNLKLYSHWASCNFLILNV